MMSTKGFSVVILVLALAASTCYATKYKDCPDKKLTATINKVTVSPCPTLPCRLVKGTNVSVSVDFTMGSHSMAKTATTSVHGVIGDVQVPYETDYTDACKTAGLKCPLKPSSDNIYKAKLYVSKIDPDIELYVEWELLDETKNDIFCFQIPVVITG